MLKEEFVIVKERKKIFSNEFRTRKNYGRFEHNFLVINSQVENLYLYLYF